MMSNRQTLIPLITIFLVVGIISGTVDTELPSSLEEPVATTPAVCLAQDSLRAEPFENTKPNWSVTPSDRLTEMPHYKARPFEDACISGLAIEIESHDSVCPGESCDKVPSAIFYWTMPLTADPNSQIYFELRTDHYGANYSAWLQPRKPGNKLPTYIHQGWLLSGETLELLDSLEANGVWQMSSSEVQDSPYSYYFKLDNAEKYVARLQPSRDPRSPEANLIHFVEDKIIGQYESDLAVGYLKGLPPHAFWNAQGGVFPGEQTSLFRELSCFSALSKDGI